MTALRVLFLEADPLTSEVRLRPLLDALKARGDLLGYAVVNRDLAVSGDNFECYDVAITHRNPSTRQMAWLRPRGAPFVYDIDDLLLEAPGNATASARPVEQAAILWCLTVAAVVSSPSRRLLTNLDARLPQSLGTRGLHLPNCGVETPPAIKPAQRPRLLWTSSAIGNLGEALAEICAGVAAAAEHLDTDVVLVGRFPPQVQAALPRHEHIAWLSHADYLAFLAKGNFIAIAPLGAGLPPAEQDFVDSKSDIKAAEYGSSRIAGAYSPTAPYVESDLPCNIVAANAAAAWRDALLKLAAEFPAQGNRLADHPAFAARRPSVVATTLLDALTAVAAATPQPLTFHAVATPGIARRIERRIRRLRQHLFAKST